jgi:hypothetical protein
MKGRIAAGKQFEANMYHALGDTLIGEWRFDETSGTEALDDSGSGNVGTLIGSPTRVPGLRGQALQFSGSGQYIQANAATVPRGGTPYTVSVWFIADDQITGYRELVSQWTSANAGNSFYLGTTQSTHIRFSDSWSNVDIGGWTAGEWHHVAVVSTDNNAYIYFDGALKATKGSALSYSGTGPVIIGRQGMLTSEYWKGKIDEVRVYERSLVSTEIEKLYAEDLPTHPLASR